MLICTFSGDSMVRNLPVNPGDAGTISGLGRSLGKGKGNSHSSILVWKIPWTQKPGKLQSMGLQRVRYDLPSKRTT